MEFQILDKNNIAITLGQLDKEAAEFWGVEITDTYVAPQGFPWMMNWFEYIGWNIASLPKGEHEWRDVVGKLCGVVAICESDTDEFLRKVRDMQPFFDLIFHWKSKGYIPVSC